MDRYCSKETIVKVKFPLIIYIELPITYKLNYTQNKPKIDLIKTIIDLPVNTEIDIPVDLDINCICDASDKK